MATMAKTELIKLRCTAEEKAKWESEAEAQGISISELARQRMNRPWCSPMKGVDPRTVITATEQVMSDPRLVQAAEVNKSYSEAVQARVTDALSAMSPGRKHHPRCTCGVCQAKK